jgi:FixJ family two-component response regulator
MTPNSALIAIIDDDASVRRALERLTRSIGFTSVSFTSGEDFFDRMGSGSAGDPDCLVLDMHLPGISGLEVQQQLAGSRLPVIFITAHDDAELCERALAAGAVSCLRKPFSADVFAKTLHAALPLRGK